MISAFKSGQFIFYEKVGENSSKRFLYFFECYRTKLTYSLVEQFLKRSFAELLGEYKMLLNWDTLSVEFD